MAPPKRPWFRFYVEAVWDRKLRRLPPAERWLWVVVLAVARQSPVPGILLLADGSEQLPMSEDDLADAAALKVSEVRHGMRAFVDLGLLTVDDETGAHAVSRWNDRQYESDDTTKRTRKHRSNGDDGTFHPPPMERSGNVDGTHQNTETDTEGSLRVSTASVPQPVNGAGPPSLAVVPTFANDLESARGHPARRALAGRMRERLLRERQVHRRHEGGLFDLIEGYLAVDVDPNELYWALLSASTLTVGSIDVELAKRRQQREPAPTKLDGSLAAIERTLLGGAS